MTVYELLRKYYDIIDTNLCEAQALLFDGKLDLVAPKIFRANAQIELMFDVTDCISDEDAKHEWKDDYLELSEYYQVIKEELKEKMKEMRE